LDCSPSVVEGADGTPGSLVIVARDVTRARELEHLRADFVATVSHELRTPLAPIKGWATTILDRGDEMGEELRREGVESILRQAHRLERLVLNLLEASKIEMGQVDVGESDVELDTLTTRVVAEFEAAWPARQFRVDIAHHGCFTRATELRVEQILSNLLSNAVKYSPDHEPVDVTVAAVDGEVLVSVRDRGPGIPADECERIFERFHRLVGTQTQAGTGLGLYIARQLAADIGGGITVDSTPGQGSCFTLHLPLVRRLIAV
jgi:signal transduction histidine kinase